MMYDIEFSSKNKTIFKLSLILSVLFLLPITYFLQLSGRKPFLYSLMIITPYILYTFLYKRVSVQIQLFRLLNTKYFINFLKLSHFFFPFSSLYIYSYLIFYSCLSFFYDCDIHWIFQCIRFYFSFLAHFFLPQKDIYLSLFSSNDFNDYLNSIKKNKEF